MEKKTLTINISDEQLQKYHNIINDRKTSEIKVEDYFHSFMKDYSRVFYIKLDISVRNPPLLTDNTDKLESRFLYFSSLPHSISMDIIFGIMIEPGYLIPCTKKDQIYFNMNLHNMFEQAKDFKTFKDKFKDRLNKEEEVEGYKFLEIPSKFKEWVDLNKIEEYKDTEIEFKFEGDPNEIS